MEKITADSFGADLPANWDVIAEYLNALIAERGIEDDREALSDLWEDYWNGVLPDAPAAIIEEEDAND